VNAVEIEEAVSALAEQPFDPAEFPYAFLQAFGNKETTIKRLRAGVSNKSDLGGVLQANHIHIAVCPPGECTKTLAALKASPATAKGKVQFVLATDGEVFEAEDLESGETVACAYKDFPDKFGFFLQLAGITTVPQLRESSFDIRATGRLNKLYVELLKDNPDWGTAERRHDMNHLMARLIFCFFAEDTDIFNGTGLFTRKIETMSERDSSNTHEVIAEIFRAMNTPTKHNGQPDNRYREAAKIKSWADVFPYVNGGLFSGSLDVPRFSRIARSYLLHIGNLDWRRINPDIFGSMIQAVAEDEERGALGMHYTSVPNILKVLNPLFLDDLRAQLVDAGTNARKLLNLRNRMAKIRVFDPACGSGNFLVIAYKQMREIEAEINLRRGEAARGSDIPLTNFRGIELRDFPAEIARLALIIAEYQSDVLYRGQKEALAEFLPLDGQNWITCGNALRLDWLSICPPTGTVVRYEAEDLFYTPRDQAQIEFENDGGETYICSNPPYLGSTWQSAEQKEDVRPIFEGRTSSWKSLDYVAGWFMKAADYGTHTRCVSALVSTNSICQGQQVPMLWPLIFSTGHEIAFAHTSFKWENLASHNAGVTVVIVGISNHPPKTRYLFSTADGGSAVVKEVGNINAYLVPGPNLFVGSTDNVLGKMSKMDNGNKAVDGGHLLLDSVDLDRLSLEGTQRSKLVRRFIGSSELINGIERYCLWINEELEAYAMSIPTIRQRIAAVEDARKRSPKKLTRDSARRPYAFRQVRQRGNEVVIVVPSVSSESRDYLPTSLMPPGTIISHKCFAFYDAPRWNMAMVASRLHWVWIGTVCVRLEMRFSYSNTLGWNTFPAPSLTDKNKADLIRCADDILLAREAHFPATIADLYDPDKMPANLREAHERNDDVLERIYIGRRFRNDTERLEHLFDRYTKMMAAQGGAKGRKAKVD